MKYFWNFILTMIILCTPAGCQYVIHEGPEWLNSPVTSSADPGGVPVLTAILVVIACCIALGNLNERKT